MDDRSFCRIIAAFSVLFSFLLEPLLILKFVDFFVPNNNFSILNLFFVIQVTCFSIIS